MKLLELLESTTRRPAQFSSCLFGCFLGFFCSGIKEILRVVSARLRPPSLEDGVQKQTDRKQRSRLRTDRSIEERERVDWHPHDLLQAVSSLPKVKFLSKKIDSQNEPACWHSADFCMALSVTCLTNRGDTVRARGLYQAWVSCATLDVAHSVFFLLALAPKHTGIASLQAFLYRASHRASAAQLQLQAALATWEYFLFRTPFLAVCLSVSVSVADGFDDAQPPQYQRCTQGAAAKVRKP